MGPCRTRHLAEGGGCDISVEHGLSLWVERLKGTARGDSAVPSEQWSCFVGAREVRAGDR